MQCIFYTLLNTLKMKIKELVIAVLFYIPVLGIVESEEGTGYPKDVASI